VLVETDESKNGSCTIRNRPDDRKREGSVRNIASVLTIPKNGKLSEMKNREFFVAEAGKKGEGEATGGGKNQSTRTNIDAPSKARKRKKRDETAAEGGSRIR